MTRARSGRDAERGSAGIWVLACCVLLLSVTGVVTVRTLAVLARHRAESAADLAALAGAGRIGVGVDECAVARAIARHNGARVSACHVSLDADGRSGSVLVAVRAQVRFPLVGSREITATARAGRLPG